MRLLVALTTALALILAPLVLTVTHGPSAHAAVVAFEIDGHNHAHSDALSHTHSNASHDSLSTQPQMTADHGHSHGEIADLFWQLHGHGHNVIDHDHSHAFIEPAVGQRDIPKSIDQAAPPTDMRGATKAPPTLPPRIAPIRLA